MIFNNDRMDVESKPKNRQATIFRCSARGFPGITGRAISARIMMTALAAIAGIFVTPWAAHSEPPAKDPASQPASIETTRIGEVSISHAKQLGLACKLYSMDNGGAYPPTLLDLYPDYIATKECFLCPMAPEQDLGYAYVGGKDTDPPKQVLLYSKAASEDGKWVVVYNDLTAEFVNKEPQRPKAQASEEAEAAKLK
jgi:hypothetical protein